MNYYEALGVTPALSLDMEDLKKRFYDRSRQWHPDRFVARPLINRWLFPQ